MHGPDGFVRRFAGTVTRAVQDDVAVPSVEAVVNRNKVVLHLHNDSGTEVSFTLAPNDFAGRAQTVRVAANKQASVNRPLGNGRYDVTVTAAGGTRFTRRPAGTVH
ncbi:hypothetical protein GCM10010440_75310 [Kitasatospora cinereorecta]